MTYFLKLQRHAFDVFYLQLLWSKFLAFWKATICQDGVDEVLQKQICVRFFFKLSQSVIILFKHVFNEVCFLAYVYQFICEHVRVWKGQDVLKVPCLEIKSSRLFPGNLDQNWRVIFTYHPRAKNNQLKKATNLVLDNTLCAYFCLHFDSFHYFNWLIVQRTLPKHGRNASFTCSSQSIISPYVLIL